MIYLEGHVYFCFCLRHILNIAINELRKAATVIMILVSVKWVTVTLTKLLKIVV